MKKMKSIQGIPLKSSILFVQQTKSYLQKMSAKKITMYGLFPAQHKMLIGIKYSCNLSTVNQQTIV